METIGLYVSVPVACFRVPRAREYFETFPVPPPATVYGMLLSICGEINRRAHEGAEVAIALLSEPSYSVVLRTMWRVKKKESGLGLGENRRPDFQELLTGVRLAVWVRAGRAEKATAPLASRVRTAVSTPQRVQRFGGLSLGESTHLVDEVKQFDRLKSVVPSQTISCRVLSAEEDGELSLPIWVDHVGSATTWGQYRLRETPLSDTESVPSEAWTTIQRESR